ncbi:hypothetical protein [Ramlibacter sp. AN1133]|uniref:hypothetical protein n=1 Tax=Ramlibacter sp. AN1133 TaxID=3133429 RepID=UPI0030BE6F44
MTGAGELPAAVLPLREELRAAAWWQDEQRRREIDHGLREPGSMVLWVFQGVQARLIEMRALQARGHDGMPGFAERMTVLQDLVARAPWRVDPDLGLVPRTEAAARQLQTPRTWQP